MLVWKWLKRLIKIYFWAQAECPDFFYSLSGVVDLRLAGTFPPFSFPFVHLFGPS
jgi:hypothetical protein